MRDLISKSYLNNLETPSCYTIDMDDFSPDIQKELQGYRLTTAQIYYRMPDHQAMLQEFIWQHYDLAPVYPRLSKFLKFWERELDGPLHSVYVAKKQLLKPSDSRFLDTEFLLQ